MSDERDRREAARHEFELDCVVLQGTSPQQGRTRNLSTTGLSLLLGAPIPISEVVVLDLALAFGDDAFSESLRLSATIVWCTPVGGQYQVGAKFARLSPRLEAFIQMFADYLNE